MRALSVVHRDLKPENVLCKSPISPDNSEMCKLTDFGTSRTTLREVTLTMTKGLGTPLYMAPEILSGQRHYNSSVDVYSYGILCACVWNDGTTPYMEFNFQSPLELQNAIVSGIRPTLMYDMPPELLELIDRALSHRPECRPSFEELGNVTDKLFPQFIE